MTTTTTRTTTYDDLPRLVSLMTGDEKHQAAAASTLDVLWVLYDRVLDISPDNVHADDRDRFLLSKGHGPAAYYAVLAAQGFFDEAWLPAWGSFDSPLGLHPDRNLVPGVEISSGSLGHGLALAVGTALGLRAQGIGSRVVVLVGDAELDEGSNQEAVEVAAALGLDALTVVVVDNASRSYGVPGRIAARFHVEGWATATVDGRDHDALEKALGARSRGRPNAVVATVEPTWCSPRQQFAATTTALLDELPDVALVWAEISGQYLREASRRHPDRVVNVGIREQLLVNVGAGMALTGLRPIVHTFGSFLVERAFEQVKLGFGHQGWVACSSGPAARSTRPRRDGPTRRRATSRCSTRSAGSRSTHPAPPPRPTPPCGPRWRARGCTMCGWSGRSTVSRSRPTAASPSYDGGRAPPWSRSGRCSTPSSRRPRDAT